MVTLISDLVNVVPEELQALPQWVMWRYEPNGDKKPKKVPYQPNSPTYKAATTNSDHWSTFETATKTEGFTGIGFVFTPDDPYCGIDLDNCIVNGKTARWAQAILEAFPGYAEISPSGNGIKLIGKGELKKAQKGQFIELYNQERYFTITGNTVDARRRVKPWPNLDDLFHSVKYIDKAIKNPAFPALFHGEWEGKFKSGSEADLAFFKELISCGVPELETLMCAIRLSGLYDEKWDREDYQERTYQEACRQVVSHQLKPEQIGQEGSTASQLLLSLVEEEVELFKTSDQSLYGAIDNRLLTMTDLKRWLTNAFKTRFHDAPPSDALKRVIETCESEAAESEDVREVYTRLGFHNDKLYLDLGERRVIEIDADGWRYCTNTPVYFRRPKTQRALPDPKHNGSLDDLLKPLLCVDDHGLALTKAFLVGCFLSTGGLAHLVLEAAQGSAKSTYTEIVKAILDPSELATRSLEGKTDAFILGARNNLILAFDNVSHISRDMSDLLCRLSTGAGWSTRTFYTNDDETTLHVRRPAILNGIGTFINRGDLASRCLFVDLAPIEERKTAAEVWALFKANHAGILAALLDAVVEAMQPKPLDPRLADDRLADFVRWVSNSHVAPNFAEAFLTSRRVGVEIATQGVSIGPAIMAYLEVHGRLRGKAEEILQTLMESHTTTSSKDFPTNGKGLSTALQRLEPDLKALGYIIDRTKKRGGVFTITKGDVGR